MTMATQKNKRIKVREKKLKKDPPLQGGLSITGRRVYDFYRQNRKIKKGNAVNEFKYFVRAANAILKAIQELMIESEGGVYVKHLGYFAFFMSPYKKRKDKYRNYKTTNKYPYYPVFFTDTGKIGKQWTMDRAFWRETIKNPSIQEIRKGRRYLLNYTAIKQLSRIIK